MCTVSFPNRQPPPQAAALSPLALAILLVGGFITAFDIFVVNIAIPSIRTDLSANFSQIGLVVSGYALAFGAFLIAGGRLGDRYGRRRVFVHGLSAFTGASLLCALAPDPVSLIAARVLQGAASALLVPQVYTLLRVTYDETGRRRAFARLGATLGVAAISGQILGGVIVWLDPFGVGWRAVFLLNLPVGLAAVAMSRVIPELTAPNAQRLDWFGIGLASLAATLLLACLLDGGESGWSIRTVIGALIALLLCGSFSLWERHLARTSGAPAIDPQIFSQRGFSAGLVIVLLIYATPTSFFLCFALLLQTGLGLSPLAAASQLTPMSVGFIAASLVAPRLVAWRGNQAIVAGMGIYAVGFLWVATRPLAFSSPSIALLCGMVVFGFGQGLSATPLLNFAIGFVEKRHAGMASGVISTMQQVGGAFGLSLVGIAFATRLAAHPPGVETTALRYAHAFSAAMACNVGATVIAAALLAWISRVPSPIACNSGGK